MTLLLLSALLFSLLLTYITGTWLADVAVAKREKKAEAAKQIELNYLLDYK